LGKQVFNTVTTESVNVSNLNNGIYIARISEEGKSVIKKIVIN
ncbi:T9SS type A sorting domain-containing protein, partial [Flavobacterium lindanitolerans]